MREIDPNTTNRAKAFKLWMQSPMPMVTMTKTYDITHLRRLARRHRIKLNMLMCYAIVKPPLSSASSTCSPSRTSSSSTTTWR